MRRPPCIRGLSRFKKGCPEKAWNGEEGCPCWVTEEFIDGKTGGKQLKSMCLDVADYALTKSLLARMEGVQVATEGVRNNMPKAIKLVVDAESVRAAKQLHGSGPRVIELGKN